MKILFTWILTFLLLLASSLTYAHDASKYHVLVLHSYNKGLPWTDNIQKGIESVLEPMADQLELKVEYMDSKIIKFDDKFKTKLYDLYKHKYSTSRFNVIISSDDNALSFLREYHNDLFPDTPIVFCGVNDTNIPNIIDRNLFSGILEIAAERETLDLALQLHPQTKKVVIICDNTPTGKVRWKQTEQMFKDYPQLQFSRIDSSYSIAEIEEKVKILHDDTIGIFATLYRDKSDTFFSLKEGVERVSSASRRPIYTFHAMMLQYGTVGGKLLGGFQHGYLVAELAQRIFRGERTADIPIIDKSIAQYMFNYPELKRFGIDLSKLPKDSLITGKPFSYYEEYKTLVWSVLFVTLVLTSIICILVLNIIKRKKAEKELIKEQTFTEKVINSMPGVFYTFNEEQQLVKWNKNLQSLLGKSAEELAQGGVHILDRIPDEEKERIVKAIQHAERTGENLSLEANFLTNDGSKIPMFHTASHIDFGSEKYLLGVGIDISGRKKLEAELQQAQKMEAIGTLAGGIAHDFNNILGAIFGFTQLAKDEVNDVESMRKDLDEVLKGAERAKELVKQILTFSRKNDQELQPLKIQLVIKEALKLLRSSIPTTIEIKQDINSDCDAILADPTQIHQVVMNLCTNAYHAMRETGGVLGVSLKPVELTPDIVDNKIYLSPGAYVKLEISDTGTGITKDVQERIFEPYYTTKTKGEGTGLGLAVVHGIITNLHGDITVYSEINSGTIFRVYLPVVASATDTIQKKTTTLIPTGDERILLVDDDPAIAQMTTKILERLGYKVTASTSSVDTLHKFKHEPNSFDLLITDMTMPNMTGSELTTQILTIRPDMKIILCSGFSDLINEDKAKAIGIYDYVMKPVAKNDLAVTVRKALDAS